VFPIQALRWNLLMRCPQLHVGYGRTPCLMLAGPFFNMCLPGPTGGALARAYYAAAGSDRRTSAVVSVAVDRVAGLLGLLVLAGFVGLLRLDHPVVASLTWAVWGGLLIGAVALAIYLSPPVRKLLAAKRHDAKPPRTVGLLRRVDAAVVAYRHHKAAVVGGMLLSLPVHGCLVLAVALAGYAVGVRLPLLDFAGLLPAVFVAGAVPVSPSGLGVMEGAAVMLLEATAVQVVSIMLIYRLAQLFYAVIGAVIMMVKDVRLHADAGATAPEPPVTG